MKGVCGPRVEYVPQTSHESVAILAGIFLTCLSIKGVRMYNGMGVEFTDFISFS